jgi:hypothetical protein
MLDDASTAEMPSRGATTPPFCIVAPSRQKTPLGSYERSDM